MDQKSQKLGKLYGGSSLETGVGKNKPESYQAGSKYKAAGTFTTGPRRNDASIGHSAKGSSVSGTEGDEKNEDSAGAASGKRGNVKA